VRFLFLKRFFFVQVCPAYSSFSPFQSLLSRPPSLVFLLMVPPIPISSIRCCTSVVSGFSIPGHFTQRIQAELTILFRPVALLPLWLLFSPPPLRNSSLFAGQLLFSLVSLPARPRHNSPTQTERKYPPASPAMAVGSSFDQLP